MKYVVELVFKESDHLLSKYVEDEEEIFVIGEDGEFYPANEFFYMVVVKKFETV